MIKDISRIPQADVAASTGSAKPNLGFSVQEGNALKGVLICLIVLGHNTQLTETYSGLYLFLYTFHFRCFLILPFLFPHPPLKWPFLRDRGIRYLVPWLFFAIFAAVLYRFFVVPSGEGIFEFPKQAVNLLVSSKDSLKTATGFSLFWFLPALFLLVFWRGLITETRRWIGVPFFLVAFSLFLFEGSIPYLVHIAIPWSVDEVGYCLSIGFGVYFLWKYVKDHPARRWIMLVVGSIGFVVAASVLIHFLRDDLVWSEYFLRPSVLRPVTFAVTGGMVLGAFFVLLLTARYYRYVPWITQCGEYSIIIYLLHSFIFQAWVRIFSRLANWTGLESDSMLLKWTGFAVTVLASLVVAALLARWRWFMRLVFPRSYSDWILGRLFSRRCVSE